MLRKKFKLRALETEPDFRYRGKEHSRIEGFSDDVLAFCITLLIVSLSVPESFNDLMKAFSGLFGFAISVLILFGIWYEHYIFFLRYGLKDKTTVYLNSLLLFTILIYIYPLKFLFSFCASFFRTLFNHFFWGNDIQAELDYIFTHTISYSQMPLLMALYGVGASAIFLIFALLYNNAWKRRYVMELNEMEKFYTKWSIYKNLCLAIPPFISTLFSLIMLTHSARLAFKFAVAAYGLYGIMSIFGIMEKRAKSQIKTGFGKK